MKKGIGDDEWCSGRLVVENMVHSGELGRKMELTGEASRVVRMLIKCGLASLARGASIRGSGIDVMEMVVVERGIEAI